MESRFQPVLLEVTGKPAFANLGVVSPSMFGQTTFQLMETRIVEKTKRAIARRYCEVLLCEVDSAEIVEDGNPVLLVLGFLTVGLFGIGLLFIILYFFIKNRYFIIRSGNNVQVLAIKNGDGMEQCTSFMNEVLKRAEKLKDYPH